MNKLSTHYYDKKLQKIDLPTSSKEKFNLVIDEMIEYVKNKKYGSDSIWSLKLFRDSNNYDKCDNLNVKDILPALWDKMKQHKLCDDEWIWKYGIIEIKNGSCPQGRTKRLMQVYLPLVDLKES